MTFRQWYEANKGAWPKVGDTGVTTDSLLAALVEFRAGKNISKSINAWGEDALSALEGITRP